MQLKSNRESSSSSGMAAVMPTGWNPLKLIANFAENLHALLSKEVWLLEGGADNSQESHSILFVGNRPERHYCGRLFFKEGFACRSLGHFWLWQILFPGKAVHRTHSFCVLQTRWPVTKYAFFTRWFCLPTWVYGSVDLRADYRKFARKSKSAKNTLRKVWKSGFKVEITSDLAAFDEFFHRLHQPYMYSRHGNSAVEESHKRMRAKFKKNGELLFITKGSKRVAGCMLQYRKKGVTAYRLGVREGNFKWVEKGAISALYFHILTYCRLRGFRKLNLGGSRPFLSDGVLNYKLRNWNMKIEDYSKHFYFLVKPLAMNPFTRAFLCDNPFVSLKGTMMVVNAFFPDTDGLPVKKAANRLKSNFADLGLLNVAMHPCSQKVPGKACENQAHAYR